MVATGIEKLIADVEEATRALENAYDRLIEGVPDAHQAKECATNARRAMNLNAWVGGLRIAHDEYIRPKGPPIALEIVGDHGVRECRRRDAEFVRATTAQVTIRDGGRELRFWRRNGEEVGKETGYVSKQIRGHRIPLARWRVPADELARVDDLAKAAASSKPKKKTG